MGALLGASQRVLVSSSAVNRGTVALEGLHAEVGYDLPSFWCIRLGYFSGLCLARRSTEWAPTTSMRRCRTNKAYSGDRRKSLAVAIRAMLRRDPLLERADQRL